MYFFYKIGSRNERPGTTGISHFFEHMMFNGAKKYGPKQFDVQMEKNGGNNNAYTSQDVTVYTDWFPPTALGLMFDMESDRIRDLAFDPKIIESERGVVYSERRTSVDNSNFGMLREQLNAAAYIAHPYHWPVVGWPSDIEAWTMDGPEGALPDGLCAEQLRDGGSGRRHHGRCAGTGKKYIEPIPSHDPPPPVRTKEPEQLGERRLVIERAAQLPIQMIAYHVPESKHADRPALEVLDAILTAGESSRLYRRMVDVEQMALSVGCNVGRNLDPGLMTFVIQPRSGIEPARTEKTLYEEIDRVRTVDVPAEELRKAKNQLLAQHYRQLKTMAGRANLLGTYEVFNGSYTKLFTAGQDIEAVTADDIKRVAAKYLSEKNRSVATLLPEKPKAAAAEVRK